MDLGWSGLTPSEQLIGISGGVLGLGFGLAVLTAPRALFGGLHLRRRQRRKQRKRKGRRR